MMGGAKIRSGVVFSGDGLDDTIEVSGLAFVAAKSGIYYELTETALQHRLSGLRQNILFLRRYTAAERVDAFLDDLNLRIGRTWDVRILLIPLA